MLVRHAPILAAALMLAACGGATPSSPSLPPVQSGAFERGLKEPVLIALDDNSGRLEYWPLRSSGSDRPKFLSAKLGVSRAAGMVGNGDVVSIASASPAELLTYDIDAKTATAVVDPFGAPVDVAIDANATRYVLDSAGVTVFTDGSTQPYQLTCSLLAFGEAIAVDNEGDVFVNGYAPGQGETAEVVEFPFGSSQCTKVSIRQEKAYVTGVGIDPNTDDLIIVDNVGCAGGEVGTMLVYGKPYRSKIVSRGHLRGNCPQQFRLDATATHFLFRDNEPELPRGHRSRVCRTTCITERLYPGLREPAIYTGGDIGGFTTIPNRLPN